MSSPVPTQDVLEEIPLVVKKLYGGEVSLYFDPDQHIYSTDPELSKKVYGVTNIVKILDKPFLVPAAVKVVLDHIRGIGEDAHRRNVGGGEAFVEVMNSLQEARNLYRTKWNEAAVKGTKTHKWVENHIKGISQPLPDDQEVKNAVLAYFQFIDKYKPEFILSEEMVYSKKYNYAGTLDFTAKINGKLMLGDFKTSSDVYDNYFLETAARIKARREEYPKEKYHGMILVRLGKDGTMKVKESTEVERYFEGFKAAITLTKLFKEKQ